MKFVYRSWLPLRALILLCFFLSHALQAFPQRTSSSPDARAHPLFTDITAQSGINFRNYPPLFDQKIRHVNALWANFISPAAVGDFNNDGLDDIFFVSSRAGQENALYRNRGGMTFENVIQGTGLEQLNNAENVCTVALWFDFDNNGWLDLFIGRFGHSLLFRNNADGTFSDVTEASGLGKTHRNLISAVAFDYDNNGTLDLLLGGFFADDADLFNLKTTRILPNDGHRANNGGTKALFRNDGKGVFTDVTAQANIKDTGFTTALGHADYDNDGWQDFYVANDFGTDRLFHNNRDGTFNDVTGQAIGYDRKKGMNVDFGDYNNDGLLDLYVTNITEPWFRECNMLWLNMSDGMFVDVSQETGTCDTGWGWGAKFFDYDNDGLLDLYVANGFISGGKENYVSDVDRWQNAFDKRQTLDLSDAKMWPAVGAKTFAGYERNCLFNNLGDHVFKNVAAQTRTDSILDGRGVALADFDNNGAMDVLVTNSDAPPTLYRNTLVQNRHWVEFKLTGTRSNRFAIGARVKVVTGLTTQIREINCGNGYQSQSTLRLHFGLGAARQIDLVEVRWPNGAVETFKNVAADRLIQLTEADRARAARSNGTRHASRSPNDTSSSKRFTRDIESPPPRVNTWDDDSARFHPR